MKNSNQHYSQQGLSIIEIIISLFIVGVGLVLYSAVSNATMLSKQVKYREIALKIASSEIETLRATPYATLPVSGSITNPALASLPQAQAERLVADFNASTKHVTATVTWQEPGAPVPQSVRLDTLITLGGLNAPPAGN